MAFPKNGMFFTRMGCASSVVCEICILLFVVRVFQAITSAPYIALFLLLSDFGQAQPQEENGREQRQDNRLKHLHSFGLRNCSHCIGEHGSPRSMASVSVRFFEYLSTRCGSERCSDLNLPTLDKLTLQMPQQTQYWRRASVSAESWCKPPQPPEREVPGRSPAMQSPRPRRRTAAQARISVPGPWQMVGISVAVRT